LDEDDKIKKSLDLSSKNLSSIPDSCLNFQYREIDIAFNQLKILPKEWMARQKDLEVLIATFNDLTEWPVINSKNRSIKFLDLQANHIATIPRDINLLDSLKELSLKENKITHLPESFWYIPALCEVKLSFNYIIKISPATKCYGPTK
jgi:Leucine-rich repeat (LRR) protein